ncbi:MAG TPA: GspH/FimT family pseudopilin [Desulfuromonadales bacterium]
MTETEKGFTLMEVLIVIAIVGILAAMSLPSLTSWIQNAKYRETAREMFSLAQQARALSISRNLEHRVRFDLDNKRYRLERGDRPANSGTWTSVVDWIAFPDFAVIKRTNDCDQTSGTADFSFNPNGSSNSTYVCIMEASNPTVRRFLVGISHWSTGRVTITK